MSSRFINPVPQFLDNAGDPIVNGVVYFYENGTTTPKNTYSDVNQTTVNANPLPLTADGRIPNCYYTGTARVKVVHDGGTLFDRDGVGDTNEGAAFSTWNSVTEYADGALVEASDGNYYRSLQALNQGNDPTTAAAYWEQIQFVRTWNTNVTYNIGDFVKGSDGVFYNSLTNSNSGNNPISDAVNWGIFNPFDQSLDTTDDVGFNSVATDTINEQSAAAGVTVDGVLLKDGGAVFADGASIEVDTINEATAAAGVTIDGVLLKDNGITATGGGSLTGTWSDLGTVTTVDINGGTIDGTVIGGSSAAAGNFTNGDFSGTCTIATIDANSGVIDSTIIGSVSAAAGSFTTINADDNVTITSGYVSVTDSADTRMIYGTNTNGSFTSDFYQAITTRTASTAFGFMGLYSDGSGALDREFNFRGDGNGFCDGSFTGGGADYAEWFEIDGGNPNNDDWVGYTVALSGNKIVKAESDPSLPILGVVSGNPSVVGDGDIGRWKDKYLKDDFGRYVFEEYELVEWFVVTQEASDAVPAVWSEPEIDESGNIITPSVLLVKQQPAKEEKKEHYSYHVDRLPEGVVPPENSVFSTHDDKGNVLKRRKPNPAFDPSLEYISREDRPEWQCVGLMGKLRVRKGQPTGANWIKMRDVSADVEEWLVK